MKVKNTTATANTTTKIKIKVTTVAGAVYRIYIENSVQLILAEFTVVRRNSTRFLLAKSCSAVRAFSRQ